MRKKIEQKRHGVNSPLDALCGAVAEGRDAVRVTGLHGSSRALIIAGLFRRLKRTLLAVTPSVREAEDLARDISFFLDSGEVLLHAPWDVRLLSSDEIISLQQDTIVARTRVLTRLLAGGPLVVVAPVESLLQRVMPLSVLGDYLETIAPGIRLDRDGFVRKLLAGGYQRVSLVEEPGEFSVRGFILDIFSPAENRPVRIEFYGDDVESMRWFDPQTQRSLKEASSFITAPAGEIVVTEASQRNALQRLRERSAELGVPKQRRDSLADFIESGVVPAAAMQFLPLYYGEPGSGEEGPAGAPDTLLDYMPGGGITAFLDPSGIEAAEKDMRERIDGFIERAHEEERFFMDPSSLFVSLDHVMRTCGEGRRLFFDEFRGDRDRQSFHFSTEPQVGLKSTVPHAREEGDGLLAPFAERVRAWTEAGVLVVFLATGDELRHVNRLFQAYSLPAEQADRSFFPELEHAAAGGRLLLMEGSVSEGFFSDSLKLALVCGEDLFGKKIRRRRRIAPREGYFLKSFGELKEGDFVVHMDHGIGIYRGLKRLSAAGIDNDFLLLEYAGGDRLYLPVDRLDQVQRYIGPDGFSPPVDRLGGTSWETVKKRVKESIRKIAEDLVALYASREVMEGRSFSISERDYEEFSASFEYEETPDQARAIDEVNSDMTDRRPMDRLVCGDAGFGKTEVALRAAFRAAMDGTQVAVLVPTTILAEQHYRVFSARFAPWPVRVEVLNRFRTAKEQRAIVEDVNRGLVDIVIGTHRLLQTDVTFRNLGLVIIDEEQRFGVAHKEKLKKLRTLVDVLTLTATPIPRTLQLSLVGLRDLSVIDTAPRERQAVKVYVAEFDEELIRDAVTDELNRGGQVFFIHDRVQSIEGMARMVRRIVPAARIAVAHGRMKTRELEEVMVRFLKREIDVLVCTTIVGSGVDVPAVNTIIINRADRFGLSQLYQLRGRVGRAAESATAWLLTPRGAVLTKDAKKRLRVAQELSDPGSGFKVSTYDLEIRGAGNMLGVSQSGHASAVGYELYMELMEKAVGELQGREAAQVQVQPEIHLGIPAYIPDEYVEDTQSRLVIYKRASLAASEEDLSDLRNELADRYGPIQTAVDNLLRIIGIRIRLRDIRARELVYDGSRLSLAFTRETTIPPEKIVAVAEKRRDIAQFSADSRLSLIMPGLDHEERLEESNRLIDLLAGDGTAA